LHTICTSVHNSQAVKLFVMTYVNKVVLNFSFATKFSSQHG